ncbi:MAG: hypothetical protein QF704_16340, partial [Anaerolineales bacterium]|nr:hypothetical protein [Anaerolineales bacterium]
MYKTSASSSTKTDDTVVAVLASAIYMLFDITWKSLDVSGVISKGGSTMNVVVDVATILRVWP